MVSLAFSGFWVAKVLLKPQFFSWGPDVIEVRELRLSAHTTSTAYITTMLKLLALLLLSTGVDAAYVGNVGGVVRPAAGARAATDVRMSTEVTFGDASRKALLAGIDAVANAVKVTLGPKGRNVVLERAYGVPEIVNDGVTIAREIELEDAKANVGAKLLVEVCTPVPASRADEKPRRASHARFLSGPHSFAPPTLLFPCRLHSGRSQSRDTCARGPLAQVASKTDQKAGDGTTTSTVLTQALVREGLKLVASGANPIALQRGLQKASKLLAAEVKELARPVDEDKDIQAVATIATGSESMGRTIANCFKRVGANGATMVEDGQTLTDEIDFTEGMVRRPSLPTPPPQPLSPALASVEAAAG